MLCGLVDLFDDEPGDVRFSVFSYYPRRDAADNTRANLRVLSGTPLNLLLNILPRCLLVGLLRRCGLPIPGFLLSREIRSIDDADVVLDVGGTTFTDAKQIKAIFSVLCLLPGVLLGKKQIKVSQTMGPFRKKLNRRLAKLVLPGLDHVIGRGRESERCLKELGIRQATFLPDTSFAMEISDAVKTNIEERYLPSLRDTTVVGVAPNSIVDGYCIRRGKDHAAVFATFIDAVIDRGFFVLLIPHSMRPGSGSRHNNDLFTVHNIYRQLKNREHCLKVEMNHSPAELRSLIGHTDFFIASRFHSMISALATEVPLNVYGWGYHKYTEVMSEFELLDYVFDYRSLDPQVMLENVDILIESRDEVRERIAANLPRAIASARRHAEIIRQCAEERTGR